MMRRRYSGKYHNHQPKSPLRWGRITAGLLALLFIATVPVDTVRALSDLEREAGDVLFWGGSGSSGSSACQASDGTVLVQANIPQETLNFLDANSFDDNVAANMNNYMHAQEQTGVPWEALAALHWREANNRTGRSILNGQEITGGLYTNVDGRIIEDNPMADAVAAAEAFIEMAEGVYGIAVASGDAESLPIASWGQAFLAYNRGYLYKNNGYDYTDSPYVMNGFSPEFQNMNWVGGAADPGSSTRGGGADGNIAGALTILAYLSEGTWNDTCGGMSAVTGGVVETAMGLALPYKVENYTHIQPSSASTEYQQAISQYNYTGRLNSGIVTDCGRFVSTVMHMSGVDTDFPSVLVDPTIVNHMRNSDLYTSLGSVGVNELQPGDLLTTPTHIAIYVGPQDDGTTVMVDASYTQRVPAVRDMSNLQHFLDRGAQAWRVQ